MTKRGCCYECASGHATELHHVWDEAISPAAVEIPANWHRAFHARRHERCGILNRPGADPLHRIAAAAVRVGEAADALADFARQQGWPPWIANLAAIFAEAMTSAAHWLLLLAGQLDKVIGPDWAVRLGMPPWSPPEAP
jgi:hypothetical protein